MKPVYAFISLMIFAHISNMIKIIFYCNSVLNHQIFTICMCMPWKQYNNDHLIWNWMRAQWNCESQLTQWGRVTHICVSKIIIIGSDKGLSPGRRQAIIWTNAGLLLIEPLGTNFSEISIGIQTFSFKKMHLNMSSAKWRPFCLGLNVLKHEMIF